MIAPIKTMDALAEIGFAPTAAGLAYRFADMELCAVEAVNQWFVPAVNLGGVYRDARTLCMVDYNMPKMVESEEQCLAFLAYALRGYEPTDPPQWLSAGRNLSAHLPWAQESAARRAAMALRSAAYEACPKCHADRQLFRPICKRLREFAEANDGDADARWSFDGAVLRADVADKTFLCQADGTPWSETVSVKLGDLMKLPKRLMADPVTVAVWEGRLMVDSAGFALTQAT
jgi:hypothetical protein